MNRRRLGRTDFQVSEIAFGGVEIGMPYGLGVKSEADMLSENEAIRLLHQSVDQGINFFDTARLYGHSENIIGKAFVDRRDKVIISTKCRQFRDREGRLLADHKLEKLIRDSLTESLTALCTDYVDIFMLHQADLEILDNETIARVFSQLKRDGLTRAIGASTYQTPETEKVIRSGVWEVVQLPFNLLDQRQLSCFALAEAHGVGVVIRSVLLKGLLSNRAADLHPSLQHVRDHIENYDQLLGPKFPDLPTLAIKFALSFPEVSSVLVGIDRPEYLHHAVMCADDSYMNQVELKQAETMAFADPGFLNLPHWEKMGWLT